MHWSPEVSYPDSRSQAYFIAMSSKDLHRVRLSSPEGGQSDGTSVQVNEASSNKYYFQPLSSAAMATDLLFRAQSMAPISRRQTPEPSSSSRHPPNTPALIPSLRNRLSMEDDLRGVDSRLVPHGVKRPRDDSSDDEISDSEPTPKRDRLLEELDDLEATHHVDDVQNGFAGPDAKQNDSTIAQNGETSPSSNCVDLPLRYQSRPLSPPKTLGPSSGSSRPEKQTRFPRSRRHSPHTSGET